METEAAKLKRRFAHLNKELEGEFPDQAIDSIINFYDQYQNHLSRNFEVMSRTAYMDMLQFCAEKCSCFLGSSRVSAKFLLQGNFPKKKFHELKENHPLYVKFFVSEMFPILVTCVSTWYFIYLKVLLKMQWEPMYGAWSVFMFYIFVKWCQFSYQKWEKDRPVTAFSLEDSRHITERFRDYNEKLSVLVSLGYPVIRLFVLEKDIIKTDNKKIKIKGRGKVSWWDLMVEEHAKKNIKIARIELTKKYKRTHPAIDHQFSLFTIPGVGGWVIQLQELHLDSAVHVGIKGKEVLNTYSSLCRDIRAIAQMYILENGKVKRTEAKVHDFTECFKCPEEGNTNCKHMKLNCPRIK